MPSQSRVIATFAAAVIFCFLPGANHAQTAQRSKTIEAFRPHFQSVLRQHGVIGGGFALVHDNAPAETLAFGEVSIGSHRPVDSATAYNWASITKTMTAIAILQLRDRGKLSLDDPAVRYIPELRQVHDQFGPIDAITIRHLLTHSRWIQKPYLALGL